MLKASRPTWARGLKQQKIDTQNLEDWVAPHVGAWIETFFDYQAQERKKVAPHVGAWIETLALYPA